MPKAPLEQRSDDLQPKHANAASPLEARKKKRSIIILAVLLAFLLCGVAAGCGYLIWQQAELDRVAEEMKNTPEPVVEQPAQDTADNRVENPIDFTSLKQENPDIYAWIHGSRHRCEPPCAAERHERLPLPRP